MYDPLFKGCTRPAMLLGVPIGPMVLVNGLLFLIGLFLHPILWLLVVLATLVMRAIVKQDDQQFRLLGLKFQFRVARPNRNAALWKSSAYAPVTFVKRKSQ